MTGYENASKAQVRKAAHDAAITEGRCSAIAPAAGAFALLSLVYVAAMLAVCAAYHVWNGGLIGFWATAGLASAAASVTSGLALRKARRQGRLARRELRRR